MLIKVHLSDIGYQPQYRTPLGPSVEGGRYSGHEEVLQPSVDLTLGSSSSSSSSNNNFFLLLHTIDTEC
ncbi:hypothetical protein Pmani_006047 [Petrolisthes manimaculis]|uniref:Uncharacterized protein n=1 Tax=Petrolisthes manimaculis TaxID=1843537 RepID=A0AAE1QB35_9EUCA|nr:hypothetical protein Pmani_006047 [Petrolisthes manimaculis]